MRVGKKFGRRYPWADWFALGSFALVRGADFDCRPDTMAQMTRSAAKARELHVRIRIGEDHLDIEVLDA